MVPEQHKHIAKAVGLKSTLEVFDKELPLFMGGVEAAVPGLDRMWFVLYAQGPYVVAAPSILTEISGYVEGPVAIAFLPEPPPLDSAAVVLEVCRRRPRGEHDRYIASGFLADDIEVFEYIGLVV